ncbi:MAG: DUF2235 domain-containing protein [Phycisphaerales bacterium]
MSKNIVVFSDGTGQEGGTDHNTNVYKLFNLILDRSPWQISFYDRGLGTGWRKATGNILGRGFSRNVRQCYQFIFQNYEAGDKIYLFGFSRGAATVRSLTGFIHLFGILPRSRGDLIKKAWKIYKIKDHGIRKERAEEFVNMNHRMWAYVEFLGVWDTVAALGVPSSGFDRILDRIVPHGFHDFSLSTCVKHAYHALSIDDLRKAFNPVLFHPYRKKDDKWEWKGHSVEDPNVWQSHMEEDPRVRQVWFMGMHTDVGGGYLTKDLSDIVLEWMVQHAVRLGLLLYKNKDREDPMCTPNPNGYLENSRKTHFKRTIFKKKQRDWKREAFGQPLIPDSVILPLPIVHQSVELRTAGINNKDPDGGSTEGDALRTADINDKDPYRPYEPWILEKKYETETWTHLDDWKRDPAFKDVDEKTMEALEGWCEVDAT